ncbi:hypothetical protein LEMLEM_LOCUS9111 [Lemmus lemmus]
MSRESDPGAPTHPGIRWPAGGALNARLNLSLLCRKESLAPVPAVAAPVAAATPDPPRRSWGALTRRLHFPFLLAVPGVRC